MTARGARLCYILAPAHRGTWYALGEKQRRTLQVLKGYLSIFFNRYQLAMAVITLQHFPPFPVTMSVSICVCHHVHP